MSTSIGDLAVILSADTGRADKALHGFAGRVDKLDAKVRQFGSTSPRMPGLDRAKDKLKGIDGGGVGERLSGMFGGPWVAVGTAALAGLTVSAVGLGKSLDLAGKAEANAKAFEILLGSADKGRRLTAALKEYAATTAFSASETAELGKQLLGVGVEADQVMPAIRTFGDIAAVLGGNTTERMQRLTKAFGDVKAAGKLSAEELNQFSEAGVNLGDALAKTMGVSRDQIKKLAADGEIGFGDVAKALNSLVAKGGIFHGGASEGAKQWNGMLGQMSDAFETFGEQVGTALIEDLQLKGVLSEGLRLFERFKPLLDDMRPGLKFLGDNLRVGVKLIADQVIMSERLARVLTAGGKAFFSPEMKQLGNALESWKGLLKDLDRGDFLAAAHQGARRLLADIEPTALSVAQFADTVVVYADAIKSVWDAVAGGSKTAFGAMAEAIKFVSEPIDRLLARLKVLQKAASGDIVALAKLDMGKMIDETFKDLQGKWGEMQKPKVNLKGDFDLEAERRRQNPPKTFFDRATEAFAAMRKANDAMEYEHRKNTLTDALGPLAAEVRKNVPGLDRMATAIEKATGYANGFGGALSAGQKKLSASLRDDATRLMDQFADPTAKLKKFADNLDQMQKFGAIDDRVKGLAFGAEVDRLLKNRMTESRPAPAIEYGSQQFAQLVQQATAGGGRQDVVGAIRDMIREQRELSRIGQQQLDELRKMPQPQAVKMPGE